jgi:hypothetical protein
MTLEMTVGDVVGLVVGDTVGDAVGDAVGAKGYTTNHTSTAAVTNRSACALQYSLRVPMASTSDGRGRER